MEANCSNGIPAYHAASPMPCPTGETCIGGACVAFPPCDPPCASEQVCVEGRCIDAITHIRDRRWKDITVRIRGIQQYLNSIEKSACGAGLPTGKAVAANNAVNVNSFSALEVELTKIYEQQARIAKCKGLATVKFTKTANSENNVAALIAVTTKQTYDLKKATLKAGGKVSVDKTPITNVDKTPVTAMKKQSFFGKLFGR